MSPFRASAATISSFRASTATEESSLFAKHGKIPRCARNDGAPHGEIPRCARNDGALQAPIPAGPALAPWALILTVLLPLAGCSDIKLDQTFQKILQPRRSPQQNLVVAFSETDADARRESIANVSKSKQTRAEWAIKGYVAIALLDDNNQVRCVALRALADTGDARALDTAVKILTYRDQPPQEVRPPDDLCRWDATEIVARWSAEGKVPEEQRPAARAVLLDRLKTDADRQARVAAARGLGYYADVEAVKGLIDGLHDADFAVVHECELALVRLTGKTHDCSATVWKEWFEAHQADLFAKTGEIPPSRRLPYNNKYEKMSYDMRQLYEWMVPARKE
jgi:hypothetical protein